MLMLTCYAILKCGMYVEKKRNVEKPPILDSSCEQWMLPMQNSFFLPPLYPSCQKLFDIEDFLKSLDVSIW
jgi:hypothetical protein